MRKGNFRTAMDVFQFVNRTMPLPAPGALRADEYYAIVAFDLQANGINLGQTILSAQTAPSIRLH
jgi:hypothetical protein